MDATGPSGITSWEEARRRVMACFSHYSTSSRTVMFSSAGVDGLGAHILVFYSSPK